MKTIRICEESEARLLIREGAFKEYVLMWGNHFPQQKPFQRIKELHTTLRVPLRDAMTVADATGVHDSVLIEVGRSVVIRKHHDDYEVYRKVRDVWVLRDGGLDAFEDESLFDREPTTRHPLCSEKELLHCKDVKRLSCDVYRRLNCYDALFPFGDSEILEMKRNSTLRVYSQEPCMKCISCSEESIAKHIAGYREAHSTPCGRF